MLYVGHHHFDNGFKWLGGHLQLNRPGLFRAKTVRIYGPILFGVKRRSNDGRCLLGRRFPNRYIRQQRKVALLRDLVLERQYQIWDSRFLSQ